MNANAKFFWLLGVFFVLAGAAYTYFSVLTYGVVEWAGSVAMVLSGILGGFIAYYIGRVHKAQGGELPEDRLDSDIDDADPELGYFSPWSWWPVFLAGALALVFLGLAVGFWVSFLGLPFVAIGIVGWVYEYYRGYFAR